MLGKYVLLVFYLYIRIVPKSTYSQTNGNPITEVRLMTPKLTVTHDFALSHNMFFYYER